MYCSTNTSTLAIFDRGTKITSLAASTTSPSGCAPCCTGRTSISRPNALPSGVRRIRTTDLRCAVFVNRLEERQATDEVENALLADLAPDVHAVAFHLAHDDGDRGVGELLRVARAKV